MSCLLNDSSVPECKILLCKWFQKVFSYGASESFKLTHVCIPTPSYLRCRAFQISMKRYVMLLAVFPPIHISMHFFFNFDNLAANPSDWPVLVNQMLGNIQGSMSHRTLDLVCHRHIHETGSFSMAELREWRHHHCLPHLRGSQLWSCLPAVWWPWAGKLIYHYSVPMAQEGESGSSMGSSSLQFLTRGKGQPSSSCTCHSYWRQRCMRMFTRQHHPKLSGVEHSLWIFYKKLIIDFIAECQIQFPLFWEPFNKLYVLR